MNLERPNFQPPDMNSEQSKKSESRFGNIERFVQERLERVISPERKEELNKELVAVTDFFEKADIKPYIAGGTGLDLLDGEWNRDHQDLDMAIMGSERKSFFNAATEAGFLITDPDRNPLSIDEVVNKKTHNAFLFRSDEQGTVQFEVIFLNERNDGNLELTQNATATRESYDNAPTIRIDGHEISIQPAEVIMFHKLTDGRRKDFQDAKMVWEKLDEEQRGRLDYFLRDANVRFVIDEEEITEVETLFVRAEQTDQEKHQKFFTEKVEQFDTELSVDLMARCEEVFEIRKRTLERDNFFKEVAEKYQGFVPERRAVIEAMADELYKENSPDMNQFKKWAKEYVKMEERIKEKALFEYVSEKIWETKMEQQD